MVLLSTQLHQVHCSAEYAMNTFAGLILITNDIILGISSLHIT